MRLRNVWGLLAVLALVVALPAGAEDSSDLAGRVAAWQDAYNAGDDAAVAAHYTEDCMRLPHQAPAISGRDGVIAALAEGRAQGLASIALEVTEAGSQGDSGWGRGTYTLMDADGNVVQAGKWLNVSKKVGDTWMFHRDIWNTDTPDP